MDVYEIGIEIAGDVFPEGFLKKDKKGNIDPKELYAKHDHLIAFGLTEWKIEGYLSDGLIREVVVGRNEAVGVSGRYKMRTDTEYRKRALENIEKAKKVWAESPDYKERTKEMVDHARMICSLPAYYRRNDLRNALIKEFGELPEKISTGNARELLKKKYSGIFSKYPKDKRRCCMTLFYDLHDIGINTDCRSDSISKVLKEKFKNDPKYRKCLRKRANEMTITKKKLYEEHPEIKEEAGKKSAESRRKKFRDDEKFKKMTQENLSLGNPALWEKYRSDEEFREIVLKKQKTCLEKGHKTMKKNTRKRRRALGKKVIDKYYSGNPFTTTCRCIQEKINTVEIELRNDHYFGWASLTTIKRDLRSIRNEYERDLGTRDKYPDIEMENIESMPTADILDALGIVPKRGKGRPDKKIVEKKPSDMTTSELIEKCLGP